MKEMAKEIEQEFEKIKSKVDPKLLYNPKFISLFEIACSYVNQFTMRDRLNHSISVSEDGKNIIITDEGKNKTYGQDKDTVMSTTISLDGENITEEYSLGILYKNPNPENRDLDLNLVTAYENKVYDENGIQITYGSFSDEFPFSSRTFSGNLKGQVLTNLHKPTFGIGMMGPQLPRFYENAEAKFAYRYPQNLGVAYLVEREEKQNKHGKIKSTACAVHTEYPEELQILSSKPIAVFENGKYEPTGKYAGMSFDAVAEIYKKFFVDGIERSKTKENDPEMYDRIINVVNQSNHKSK